MKIKEIIASFAGMDPETEVFFCSSPVDRLEIASVYKDPTADHYWVDMVDPDPAVDRENARCRLNAAGLS